MIRLLLYQVGQDIYCVKRRTKQPMGYVYEIRKTCIYWVSG